MSKVMLRAFGHESSADARSIAGIDHNYHHPFSRYVSDPLRRDAAPIPERKLLKLPLAKRLTNACLWLPHRRLHESEFWLTDQWRGIGHRTTLVAAPLMHTEQTAQLPPAIYRLAFLTHSVINTIEEGPSLKDDLISRNEAIMQARTANGTWETVAAIMEGSGPTRQLGMLAAPLLAEGSAAQELLHAQKMLTLVTTLALDQLIDPIGAG